MITIPQQKMDCQNPQSPTFLNSSHLSAKIQGKSSAFSFEPIQSSTSITHQVIKIEEFQITKPERCLTGFSSSDSLQGGEEMRCFSIEFKLQKNGNEEEKMGVLPLMTRQKLSMGEDAFEMPDLTAQSVVSSQEHDVDSQSNGNQLPISSANRHKIRRMFHEQSDQSQEMNENDQNYRIYHRGQDYAQSKEGDRSQSDDIITICQHCTSLFDKCKRLQAENRQFVKQNRILVEEIAKYQQSTQQELIESPISQSFRQEESSPPLIKDLFLFQIQESYKTLIKINDLLHSYSIDFTDNQCTTIEKFSEQFKKIDLNVLGRQVKNDRKQTIQQIHANYKKMIEKLIKNYEHKLFKRDSDFKKAMKLFMQKHPVDQKQSHLTLSVPLKLQRHRKKSKTFAEKEEATDELFLKSLLEQGRQKMQWLELNLQREQERSKNLEKNQKEQNQKYIIQINDLIKQKAAYKNQVAKCSQQFTDFIQKLAKTQVKDLNESQFFKNVSKRVFEISNSIPFEDNDEQNLFVPENEVQLFEMIERIRKFYLKFESYNLERDNYYESEKSLLIHFIKEVIEESKISQYYILELLAKKEYKDLNYLKQIIFTSKLRKNSLQLQIDPKNQRLSLRREGVGSFTFENGRIAK